MKKRILTFCLAVVLLVATITIPVIAAVPEDVPSMVNFLDLSMMDGVTGTLYNDYEGDMEVDFVLLFDELNNALNVEWETNFTSDYYGDFYMILDTTYQEVSPYLSEYAYAQGAYVGTGIPDIYPMDFYFTNTDLVKLNESTMLFEDFMEDNVVMYFYDTSNIESLIMIEYPIIVQNYGSFTDYAGWSNIAYLAWTPYNEEYFEDSDQAYQEGYDAGYQEGYDDLYADAGVGEFDILSTATYTLEFTGELGVDVTLPWNPIIYAGGVSFKNFDYSVVESLYPDACYVHLTWDDANIWNWGSLPFGVDGNSLIQDLRIVTVDGNTYSAYAEQIAGYRPFVLDLSQSIIYPIEVKELIVMVGRPEDLLYEFDLITSNKFYNNGYSAGYLEGVKAGNQEAYNNGFRSGREEGYLVGKAEGLDLAERGDWRNLFTSVVEAPLHVFNSLFNFEILGLDMRDFMASMFTLCLVVLVFNKFLGGL